MKDATEGYRSYRKVILDGGRVACIHGDVCMEYLNAIGKIISARCPYECKFYKPVKQE